MPYPEWEAHGTQLFLCSFAIWPWPAAQALCTCDSAAQMSQMFANPSSTLPYPEPGALSSTAPRLIRLILITATFQFWSKGAQSLMGAPWAKDLKKDLSWRKKQFYCKGCFIQTQIILLRVFILAFILLLPVKTQHCQWVTDMMHVWRWRNHFPAASVGQTLLQWARQVQASLSLSPSAAPCSAGCGSQIQLMKHRNLSSPASLLHRNSPMEVISTDI